MRPLGHPADPGTIGHRPSAAKVTIPVRVSRLPRVRVTAYRRAAITLTVDTEGNPMTSRQPRHGPENFYGSSGPATPPGGAWPPPPLWRSAVAPMPARRTSPGAAPDEAAPDAGRVPAPRRWSMKHLVGYPATALLALAVGAAPSGGTTSATAPSTVERPAPPAVTVTVPAPAHTVAMGAMAPAGTRRDKVRAASAGAAPGAASAGDTPQAGSAAETASYRNCAEARAAGAAPLAAGDAGYRTTLDRDRDGVACE
jgi:hypothetical protein